MINYYYQVMENGEAIVRCVFVDDSGRWVNTDAAMQLDKASKAFGPSLLYLGDGDLVYVYPSVASK